MQEELAETVTELEWELFQRVHNAGGRASCQDNRPMFFLNRMSQFLAWSHAVLESYHRDLIAAGESGRNLVMEKYARMMARTSPGEYAAIAAALPEVTPEKAALVDAAVAVQLPWQELFAEAYPALAGLGRPIRKEDERENAASFETYLRGELLTYSENTLRLYVADLHSLLEEGGNISLDAMEHMARLNGFASLREAEEHAEGSLSDENA